MKKFLNVGLLLILVLVLVACQGKGSGEDVEGQGPEPEVQSVEGDVEQVQDFKEGLIHVVSREDGSGTRGAFTEIAGILEKDGDGNEVDNTYIEATIQNSTEAVTSTVASDEDSIGYISLGSLNNTVKAIHVDGVEATVDEIKAGNYAIARPFNLCYKEGNLTEEAEDFMTFILSADGEAIIAGDGYIPVEAKGDYKPLLGQGNIVVAGSTSVTPVMEKLVDGYKALNPDVSIEIQSTGSSAGIKAVQEGIADIGMASRELKDSELETVKDVVMAMDGIAVIISNENPVDSLTLDQIRQIFIGEITNWAEVQ